MEISQKWQEQISKPEPPNTNTVWSSTFNPGKIHRVTLDGTLLFATVSDILVVYNVENGDVVTKPSKAAKEPVNCIAFSKDGKMFATGSTDKTCVLWKFNLEAERKIEPHLKFTLSDSVLTLSFNPLTQELFVGGAGDFALFTPGKQDIPKEKYKEKILCSAWSPDGQTLAFGTMQGTISIRERNLDERNEIRKTAPIWCMQWTPITADHQESYLLVGCWDKTFYYLNSEGEVREKIAQKHIPFNPISVNFHPSGEYFIVSGTNKKVSVWSRDLGFLSDIVDTRDWSWSVKFRPKTMEMAVTTNDGLITMYELSKKPIFSNYQELFATRDNLTDIIVQNLIVNQKLRIKCKQLIKKVSIFKDKLAVLQNQRLLIYIAAEDTLKYNPFKKITKKFDCQFMAILNSHVVVSKNTKAQLYNFMGELERQWIFQSEVTYMKALGGPPKRQHLILGFKNGQIFKIFIDNSFPILLFKSTAAIRCCDLNITKKRLAVVDTNNNLTVMDLITQAHLYQEMGIVSCVWNADLEDVLAYSGTGVLSIRTGSMPALTQKSEAVVQGFKGFQLFVIKQGKLALMDVSQSSTLVKFIEKKDFKMAYKLACLGVTDNDTRMLGVQALQNMDFEVAQKCFIKLKDLPFVELCKKYAEIHKQGNLNENILKAQVLAYQGKYQEAANTYVKAGAADQAMNLFSELKRFDEAQRFARNAIGRDDADGKAVMSGILNAQAEWAMQNGQWKTAAELYMAGKNYKKAIEIYGKEGHMDGLVEVCRILDKADNEANLIQCANLFRKYKNHAFAKEAYLKLGDVKSLMSLHIEMERWDDVFLLGRQNKELLEMAKLPYANFLMKNDRYEDALKVYKNLGRNDLTQKMLITLGNNSVSERRFLDAARHYWTMALQQLRLVKDIKNVSPDDRPTYAKYQELKTTSEVYYVYNSVNTFVESPFFTSSDSALYAVMNACRFLISKLSNMKLPYINMSYIYYSLAKVAKLLEGYKTARTCYEKLAQLKVPYKWIDEIDLGSLLVRSKPFSDKQSILPICNRCLIENPVITDSYRCFSCKHPFTMSFASFEVLPLVEFRLEPGISHSKVLELLNSEKAQNKKGKKGTRKDDGWNETKNDKQQVLAFRGRTEEIENTPFFDKMSETVEMQQTNNEYVPITLSADLIATLQVDSVYFQDLRKVNPTFQVRYFKNLVPDLLLKCCTECAHFFLLDEYEFEYIQHGRCPFCNMQDKRAGNTKDIFDQ